VIKKLLIQRVNKPNGEWSIYSSTENILEQKMQRRPHMLQLEFDQFFGPLVVNIAKTSWCITEVINNKREERGCGKCCLYEMKELGVEQASATTKIVVSFT
jgi:hypothetical protein